MPPWDKYKQQPQQAPGQIQLSPGSPIKQRAAELGVAGQAQNLEQGAVGIEGQGLTNAQKRYDIDTKPVYDRNSALQPWIDNVRNDKRIQPYEAALPIWESALRSPNTPEADNLLVNAIAKIGDPTTGVQQREGAAYEDAAPKFEQVKADLLKQFGSDGAGNFTPEGRERMKQAMTNRMKSLATAYNSARNDWRKKIQTAGLPDVDPEVILGPHMGAGFQQAEADYLGRPVRNLDRSQGAVPAGWDLQQAGGVKTYGFGEPKEKALQVDVHGYDRLPGESDEAFVRRSERLDAEHDARLIADKRGKGGIGETIDATMRGIADIPTFGMADEIAAAGDTVFSGGTMDENLRRQRLIDAYDTENHFVPRLGGQILGGFALPMGAMRTAPQIIGKSAAVGGGYGFGSGEGSLLDRGGSAAGGAGAGAATATGLLGLGAAGRKAIDTFRGPVREMPPLVDPVSGRLNAPLETATPAQRMAAAKAYDIDLPLGAATDRGGAIVEKGLDVLPASAGTMNDARRLVEGQTTDALEGVAGRYGSAQNLYAGGQAAQRGAKNWLARAQGVKGDPSQRGVIGKAYDRIPISESTPSTLAGTRATLNDLTSEFSSNPELAAAMKSAKLEQYGQALTAGGLSWRDLKAFRSRIGYEIGEQRFSDGPTKDQLRGLYAALSDDMRATASAQGPGALRAFERANSLNAAVENRIESALVAILGDDAAKNPEAAAIAIQKIAQSGKASADLDQLRQIRASTVKDGAWDEVSSSLIRLMGQPVKSEGRAFNPQTFVQSYADMSEDARKLLFSGQGKGELRKALDGFVAVSQRLAGTNALRNTSNTTPGNIGAWSAGSIAGTVATTIMNPVAGVTAGAGLALAGATNYALGKLWTHAPFVRWATGYAKLAATGSPGAVKSHFGRLKTLAVQNPELREEIEQFGQRLFSGENNDRQREQP